MSSLDTKFADIAPGTRQRWIDWANLHDWGQGNNSAYYARHTDKLGHLITFSAEHDGHAWHQVEARHSTPRELRDWAGY